MERKTPVDYPDGVYEIAGAERGNVILIANISQHGLTGLGSTRRTALFTFFGKTCFACVSDYHCTASMNCVCGFDVVLRCSYFMQVNR